MVKNVLIIGSGPDVARSVDWDRSGVDVILAINNAWRVRPDWDRLIHPEDFPADRRPTQVDASQGVVTYRDFVPALNTHGGVVFCGATMAFVAGFWALEALKPQRIAYFGCDMVYSERGPTHFYGRGAADPLRDDPTLQSLEAKSARLSLMAAAKGCAIVNLSQARESRLTFPRSTLDAFAQGAFRDGQPTPFAARASCAPILSQERRLGYETPTGRYWREIDRFDKAKLRQIDDQWYSAALSYSEAA